jgi:hypothetical protein
VGVAAGTVLMPPCVIAAGTVLMPPCVTFVLIYRSVLKFCYVNKILRLDYSYCRSFILCHNSILHGGFVMTA